MVRVILYIYVAVILVACTKNEIKFSGDANGDMVELTISALIDDGSSVSKTTIDETTDETTGVKTEIFDDEDQIGVFLCKTAADYTVLDNGLIPYHTTSYYRNLMAEYTLPNEEWIFYVSYTGYLIVPSVYDNNSTFEGRLDCYAYYPYIRTVSGDYDDDIFDDITQVPLVNGRDVMWAVGYNPEDPYGDHDDDNKEIEIYAETPLNITLKFKRAMTRVDFEFSLQNEQTGVTVDSIILVNTDAEKQILIEKATIDGRDGAMCAQDDITYVDTVKIASLLAIDSDPAKSSIHEAVLIPFNMTQDGIDEDTSGDIEVMLVINGQRTYNSLPLKAMELERGNSYTMKILIDNFLKISTSTGLELSDKWTRDEVDIII